MSYKGHGIALFSGGLDSALAVLLILQQNIKVTALTFTTPFANNIDEKSSSAKDSSSLSERHGFKVKFIHLGDEFVEIVKNPQYGHGKNMNPCMDCRILMLREAREFMETVGADFVFTGEVLGQRPMSQHRQQLNIVAGDSGLEDKLVRPLSARLLPPTEPERSGLLDREKLESISGRSRRRQIKLAEKLGLEEYPLPAAGCLLTDPGYSRRLRDLLSHADKVDSDDFNLLRIGRHFRLDAGAKLIVGRNKEENEKILRYRKSHEYIFEAVDTGSPLTLLKGELNEKTIRLAASITARYCDLKASDAVEIAYFLDDEEPKNITIPPQIDRELEKIRI